MQAMDALLQDVRYGVRMLLRSPGFTAVAVITLALGIGANAGIFSLMEATLLRPPAGIAEPDRLVTIGRTAAGNGFDNSSYPNYRDLRDQNTVYSGVAAYHGLAISLGGGGRTERVSGLLVTGNYFRVLGVRMARGRSFADSEDVLNSASVAVISYGLWTRQFGSDSDIVGRTLSVDGKPTTIIGVTGKGFHGSESDATIDIWLPMAMAPSLLPRWVFSPDEFFFNRHAVWIMLVARLKPAVSYAQAVAETKAIYTRLRATYPEELKDTDVSVMRGIGLEPDSSREMERFSAILLGVVALLLLLACANVANLALARAVERGREVAVRVALGASRERVVRQLLTESTLVAAMAGAIGLMISMWIAGAVPKMFPSAGFVEAENVLDWRVLGFTLTVSLITGVLFGIAPALQSSRTELLPVLKEAVALAPRASRLRPILTSAQLTVSLVLLVGAGLMLRTLRNYSSIDPGFNTRDLMMMSVDPSSAGTYDEARLRLFHQQLLERLQGLPGMESATFARMAPVTRGGWGVSMKIADKRAGIQFNTVAPNYFEALGIAIVRGRSFSLQDAANAPPVAIVNETAAADIWPGENPVGKTVYLAKETKPRQIIGVVRDIKYRNLNEDSTNYLYCSMWQPYPIPQAPTTIMLRSRLPQAQVAAAVEGEVQAMDANLPVYRVRSFAEHVGVGLWRQRMAATLITGFALLALLLGAVGIYGVMAYATTQRVHEVGIRMALGAQPGHVLRLILSQAVRMSFGGIVGGIAGALVLTRVLKSLLYGVSTTDAATFVAVAGLLFGVALLASYVPARRATKVDPIVALRWE